MENALLLYGSNDKSLSSNNIFETITHQKGYYQTFRYKKSSMNESFRELDKLFPNEKKVSLSKIIGQKSLVVFVLKNLQQEIEFFPIRYATIRDVYYREAFEEYFFVVELDKFASQDAADNVLIGEHYSNENFCVEIKTNENTSSWFGMIDRVKKKMPSTVLFNIESIKPREDESDIHIEEVPIKYDKQLQSGCYLITKDKDYVINLNYCTKDTNVPGELSICDGNHFGIHEISPSKGFSEKDIKQFALCPAELKQSSQGVIKLAAHSTQTDDKEYSISINYKTKLNFLSLLLFFVGAFVSSAALFFGLSAAFKSAVTQAELYLAALPLSLGLSLLYFRFRKKK